MQLNGGANEHSNNMFATMLLPHGRRTTSGGNANELGAHRTPRSVIPLSPPQLRATQGNATAAVATTCAMRACPPKEKHSDATAQARMYMLCTCLCAHLHLLTLYMCGPLRQWHVSPSKWLGQGCSPPTPTHLMVWCGGLCWWARPLWCGVMGCGGGDGVIVGSCDVLCFTMFLFIFDCVSFL